MLSKTAWVRAAAMTGAMAIVTAAFPTGVAFAQDSSSITLEQARKGEDGTTGTGAAPGSLDSGSAKRDKNGNAGNATAGGAGEVATADGSTGGSGSTDGNAAPLPANADLLAALGILDDVTAYGIDILVGMDIPVELLPPPTTNSSPAAPSDIDTGGHGGTGSDVSTAPGSGSAPAGGSTTTAADDGANSTSSGEKKRDRPNKDADTAGDTNGGTVTDSASGS